MTFCASCSSWPCQPLSSLGVNNQTRYAATLVVCVWAEYVRCQPGLVAEATTRNWPMWQTERHPHGNTAGPKIGLLSQDVSVQHIAKLDKNVVAFASMWTMLLLCNTDPSEEERIRLWPFCKIKIIIFFFFFPIRGDYLPLSAPATSDKETLLDALWKSRKKGF